jgi:glycosyltransferase 2 family protein
MTGLGKLPLSKSPLSKSPVSKRWYVRLCLAALVFGVWLWLVELPLGSVLATIVRVSVPAFLVAMLLIALNLVVGALRWQVLVRSFGSSAPPLGATVHAYFVGFFFNTFLPASVAGDLLRASAAAPSFDTPSAPFVLVMVERLIGLAALFLLAGVVALGAGVMAPPITAGILVCGAGLGLLALALPVWARRGGRWLPAKWAGLLEGLPRLRSPLGFGLAFALSLGTQALFSLGAFVLLVRVAPGVDHWGALSVMPLAMLAIYFPTFAGFGTREAAFVLLLARYGAAESEATAASLVFGLAHVAVALLGGVAHARRKL